MELLDATQRPASRQEASVLEGSVVIIRGEVFLSVDGSSALLGPLEGAEEAVDREPGVVVVSQTGTPYLVKPEGAAASVPGGADKHYTHTQGPPSSSWSVIHNLDKYPSVSVVDSGGSQVLPDVLYVSASTLVLAFGSATSGKAYVN